MSLSTDYNTWSVHYDDDDDEQQQHNEGEWVHYGDDDEQQQHNEGEWGELLNASLLAALIYTYRAKHSRVSATWQQHAQLHITQVVFGCPLFVPRVHSLHRQ